MNKPQPPCTTCARLYPAGYSVSITHKNGDYHTLNDRFPKTEEGKQACITFARKLAEHNGFKYIGFEDMIPSWWYQNI